MNLPTNRQILVAIAETLQTRIAPATAGDPWAASELRSIDALLALVVARLDHEEAVTAADNADLQDLFDTLGDLGIHADIPDAAPGPDLNTAMRAELERLLPSLHMPARREAIAAVRAYLVRATGREQDIFATMISRRPF